MKQSPAYKLLLLVLTLWLLPLTLFSQFNLFQKAGAEDSIAAVGRQAFSDRPVQTAAPAAEQPGKPFAIWEILRPLVLLLAGFLLIYVMVLLLQLWADRNSQYRPTLLRLIPIVQVLGWTLLILLLIVTMFRPSSMVLLALWLSVGLALALAAQELIKSFIGSIVLLVEKPFQPGDKINVGSYSGEVKHIGLRTTRILTEDDAILSVPNSELINKQINNASTGEPNCQVVAEFYLPLTVDTSRVREIAFEAAHVSRYIFQEKPVAVYFSNEVKQKKSWLKMRLKAHVMDLHYEPDFKSEMTELVLRELIREGLLQENPLNKEMF